MKQRILIIGGPSSGKTTLINLLANQGYQIFPEFSRDLIQKSLQTGSDILPWEDVEAFNRKLYTGRKQQWIDAKEGLNFYDRGLHDGKAYLLVKNLPVPQKLDRKHKQFTYTNPVFFLPFWPEIYTTDDERKETAEEAKIIGECTRKVYQDLDYQIIDVPKQEASKRVKFILDHLTTHFS